MFDISQVGNPQCNVPFVLDLHKPVVTSMEYVNECPDNLTSSLISVQSKQSMKSKQFKVILLRIYVSMNCVYICVCVCVCVYVCVYTCMCVCMYVCVCVYVCVYVLYSGKVWRGESLTNLVNRPRFAKLKPSKLVLTINNLLADLLIHQTFFYQMFEMTQFAKLSPPPNFPAIRCVCMHVCEHIHGYICVTVCTCTYIYMYILCVCISVCAWITSAHICVCMFVYVFTCKYVGCIQSLDRTTGLPLKLKI